MVGETGEGKKLVVEILIKPTANNPGGIKLPTNETSAGVYENKDSPTPVERFPLPHVDLPTTVTVKKVVEGIPSTAEFPFEVTYIEAGDYENIIAEESGGANDSNYLQLGEGTEESAEFKLGNGTIYTLQNVEVGSSLTISETETYDYTPVVTVNGSSTALEPGPDEKYTVTVTPDMVITFTNVKYEIQLTKVDKNDQMITLQGAEFKLEIKDDQEQWVTVENNSGVKTDEAGRAVWTGLMPGTYRLTETQAPAGYVENNSAIEITLPTDDKDKDGIVKVTFENGKAPETGGSGTIAFTAAGLSILACAAGIFIVSRKKQRE